MADDKTQEDNIVRDYTSAMRKESEKKMEKRKEVMNRRRKMVAPRKYHMTPVNIKTLKKRFDEMTKDISKSVKEAAGIKFFNPFRQAGIYYGCVQTLYLLGSNEWHEYITVYNKMTDVMKGIMDSHNVDSWTRFQARSPRKIGQKEVLTAKDEEGRIKQNFRVLQRLGGIHPYGYRLAQVFACIDIKRLADGRYFYKLNTSFKSSVQVKPFYESKYKKPRKVVEKIEKVVVQSSELADEIVEGVMK